MYCNNKNQNNEKKSFEKGINNSRMEVCYNRMNNIEIIIIYICLIDI